MKLALVEIFQYNILVRKVAITGDWRNHFSQAQLATFSRLVGDALRRLGYEKRSERVFLCINISYQWRKFWPAMM